jgi:hypothetical protein
MSGEGPRIVVFLVLLKVWGPHPQTLETTQLMGFSRTEKSRSLAGL